MTKIVQASPGKSRRGVEVPRDSAAQTPWSTKAYLEFAAFESHSEKLDEITAAVHDDESFASLGITTKEVEAMREPAKQHADSLTALEKAVSSAMEKVKAKKRGPADDALHQLQMVKEQAQHLAKLLRSLHNVRPDALKTQESRLLLERCEKELPTAFLVKCEILMALSRVKFGDIDGMARSFMDKIEWLQVQEHMDVTKHIIELTLGKIAPATGRWVRGPELVKEPLLQLCQSIVAYDLLNEGDREDFKVLGQCLSAGEVGEDGTGVVDAAELEAVLDGWQRMDKLPETSPLYLVLQVQTVKAIRSDIIASTKKKHQSATQSRCIEACHSLLEHIDGGLFAAMVAPSCKLAAQFAQALGRAISYVSGLKKEHAKHASLQTLFDKCNASFSQLFVQVDEHMAAHSGVKCEEQLSKWSSQAKLLAQKMSVMMYPTEDLLHNLYPECAEWVTTSVRSMEARGQIWDQLLLLQRSIMFPALRRFEAHR